MLALFATVKTCFILGSRFVGCAVYNATLKGHQNQLGLKQLRRGTREHLSVPARNHWKQAPLG